MRALTPTEDLCMEVLAARHRLGENLWTFDSRNKHTLEKLVARGYVTVMHGTVQNTVRASLTTTGMAEYLDDSYVPPIMEKLKLKKKARKGSW